MVEDHAVLLKSVKKSTLARFVTVQNLCMYVCVLLFIFVPHSIEEKWWRQIQFRGRKHPKYHKEGTVCWEQRGRGDVVH